MKQIKSIINVPPMTTIDGIVSIHLLFDNSMMFSNKNSFENKKN